MRLSSQLLDMQQITQTTLLTIVCIYMRRADTFPSYLLHIVFRPVPPRRISASATGIPPQAGRFLSCKYSIPPDWKNRIFHSDNFFKLFGQISFHSCILLPLTLKYRRTEAMIIKNINLQGKQQFCNILVHVPAFFRPGESSVPHLTRIGPNTGAVVQPGLSGVEGCL